MTLLKRVVEREHVSTRTDIAGVDGKVDQILTDLTTQTTTLSTAITSSETNLTTAITNHDTSVDAQLTSILSAVGALQNDVSAAISFPYAIERPDEGTNRITRVYFYNYADGVIADVIGLPTVRILDGAGNPLTNGSDVAIDVSHRGVVIDHATATTIKESTGVYFFDFDHDYPNGGPVNANVGTYRLEVKSQETATPEYALHPRSFEVVELSGIESGFATQTGRFDTIDGDIASFRGHVDTLLGATAITNDTTDIYTMVTAIQTTSSLILLDTGTNIPAQITGLQNTLSALHGITEGLFEVNLPVVGSTSTLLTGDPTDIPGTTVTKTSNVMKKFVDFRIQVPSSARVSISVYQNIVAYDLSWKSKMTNVARTGGSIWAISDHSITDGEDVTSEATTRVITGVIAVTNTETRHSLYGEIQDTLHNGDWYLVLAGQSTVNTEPMELTPMAETRVSFAYSVISI